MNRFLINSKVSKKLFISYVFLFTIPLLFMGMLSYWWAGNIVKEQSEKSYIDILELTKNTIDNNFNDLENFYTALSKSQWLQKITFMRSSTIDYNRIDAIELNNHLKELGNYRSLNGFINELAIYIHNKNIVLSPEGLDSFDNYFTHIYKYQGINTSSIKKVIAAQQTFDRPVILPLTNVNKLANYYDNVFTYIKTLPLDNRPMASLIIMISEKTVKDIISKIQINQDASVYIVDNNNNIVLSLNSSLQMNDLVDRLYSGNAYNLPETIKDNNKNKINVYYTDSEKIPDSWRYMVLIPQKSILAKVYTIKNVTIILTLSLLFIGIMLSYVLTSKNYYSLRRLMRIIETKLNRNIEITNNKKINEYVFLENSIENFCNREKDMNNKMMECNSAVVHNIFISLLSEEIYDINSYREELIRNGYIKPYFAVVIFDVDYKGEESVCDNRSYFVYLIKKRKEIISIVNIENMKEVLETTDYLRNKLGLLNITAGIGNMYSFEYIWKSYNQAKISLDYKILKGEGSTICFDDIDVQNDNEYCFPVFYDENVLEHFRKGNIQIVRKILDKMLNCYVSKSSISLSIERYLFYKRTIESLNDLSDISLNKLLIEKKNELESMETVDKYNINMERLFKDICNVSIKQNQSYISDIRNDIINYVQQNYSDDSISLSALADNFGMTTSQMSKLFKNLMGENFIDYLTGLRINIAKQIISKSEITIEEIGKHVGYENAFTFRRAFKKNENMTPSDYKLLSHNKT